MPSNIFASITFAVIYMILKIFIMVSMYVPIWTGTCMYNQSMHTLCFSWSSITKAVPNCLRDNNYSTYIVF